MASAARRAAMGNARVVRSKAQRACVAPSRASRSERARNVQVAAPNRVRLEHATESIRAYAQASSGAKSSAFRVPAQTASSRHGQRVMGRDDVLRHVNARVLRLRVERRHATRGVRMTAIASRASAARSKPVNASPPPNAPTRRRSEPPVESLAAASRTDAATEFAKRRAVRSTTARPRSCATGRNIAWPRMPHRRLQTVDARAAMQAFRGHPARGRSRFA